MYKLIRPLLFRLPPERAHALVLAALVAASRTPGGHRLLALVGNAPEPSEQNSVEVFGLRFRNRIGLAAGFDKDAKAWQPLLALGFGHVEVGTVTPRPQPGNPPPRVFRLPEDRAIINRMGFPSAGVDAARHRLAGMRKAGVGIVGVNIGKNKDTPNERAAEDYAALAAAFAPVAHYLTVNVSSPNTEGLRALQARRALEGLLGTVCEARDAAAKGRRVPLLVKLSPDLDSAGLDAALEAVSHAGIDGVVATNTTVARPHVRSALSSEAGGLSGEPLRARSLATVRAIAASTQGRLPIIAVGGLATADHVNAALDAGASLVQVYTSLIYEGPRLVGALAKAVRSGENVGRD